YHRCGQVRLPAPGLGAVALGPASTGPSPDRIRLLQGKAACPRPPSASAAAAGVRLGDGDRHIGATSWRREMLQPAARQGERTKLSAASPPARNPRHPEGSSYARRPTSQAAHDGVLSPPNASPRCLPSELVLTQGTPMPSRDLI